jgi:DNA repair exonuclease SbcCD ATPase subunit
MNSIDFANQLLLKRVVNIKVIVTPRWKDEMQQQLQVQIQQLDGQIQQVEAQGQRMIAEIERQSIKPPGPAVLSEIESIRAQINERKSEFLEQKNQALQQLSQVQVLELEQEVSQGQLDSFFTVSKGDNLIGLMQVEVVLRDGIVEDIRAGFPNP